MMQSRESPMEPLELQRLKAKRVKRGECPDCGTMLYKTGVLGRIKKKQAISGKCMDGRCLVCEPTTTHDDDPLPAVVADNDALHSPEVPVERKKMAVPRIILTYQTNDGDAKDGALLMDMRMLGLEMDDVVSDITLDRRIRSGSEQPKRDDDDDDASDAPLEKKRSRRKVIEPPNHHEPLQKRMEHLLMATEPGQRPVRLKHPVPEEELDHPSADAENEAAIAIERPEQAPSRQRAVDLPGKLAAIHLHHSAELGSTKKLFRPDNVFVSPVAMDESYPRNILIERPEGALHASRNSSDGFLACGDGSSSKGAASSHEGSNRPPRAEIVFDLAVLSPFVEQQKKLADELDDSKPNSLRPLLDEEMHYITEDSLPPLPQQQDYATVDSSHHDTADYSAYSSKLLLMLDESDYSNPSSGGWPSLRIPRILQTTSTTGDENTNYDLSYHGVETGDVYTETGIPKVVYSSFPERSSGPEERTKGTDGHAPARGTAQQEIYIPAAIASSLASPDHRSLPASGKILPPPLELSKPSNEKMDPSSYSESNLSETLKKSLFLLEHGQLNDRESVILHLTEILWNESGRRPSTARFFLQQNGAKILATTMWASMTLPRVERAALRLFLALVTMDDDDTDQASWNDDLASLIDALLITMQTLLTDIDVQNDGCRIFGCLASRGIENDGTQSGACLAVLNAMDAHRNVESVQEWGLRALYNQCLCSKHADTNKRIVLTSRLDTSGSTGIDVLERVIGNSENHLRTGGVLEWVCRLFWCLMASKSSVSDLASFRMDSVRELLRILEVCRSTKDASPQLQEATLGLIANLVRRDHFKSFLGTPDVILLVLDAMHGNKEFVEVQIEACNAIANISSLIAPLDKEELVGAGVIQTIVGAMFAFPREKSTLQEPALRALMGLAFESPPMKMEICEPTTLDVILHVCRLDDHSTLPQQEYLCNLLASLYLSNPTSAHLCDSLGSLTDALAAFPNSEKICEACCCAFRNVSTEESNFEALLRCNIIGFLIRSMATFPHSKSIQTNCCWTMWYLCDGVDIGAQMIAEAECMKHVVSAIQSHLDSLEVLDAACGAIWSMIQHSPVLRQDFLDCATGLESVICILVMHPGAISLTENVCGILAFSSRNLRGLPASVALSGVSNVVETMCHNSRSHVILQHGSHFLRNMLVIHPQFAPDVISVIGVVITALKDAGSSHAFLAEALYFLWFLSELSLDAKSKIISMDGIPLTMSILDHYRGGAPFIEDPGLGLLRELDQVSSRR